MLARHPGYDRATSAQECFVDLPCTQEQNDKFYAAVDASIGELYDWQAILGFAVSGLPGDADNCRMTWVPKM